MVATNPRIEDLRRRIEKEPGSRLFAQLAEELRKDGELEDAIRVAREGLQKHPNYPSARMTLGRALLDTGDWTAARTEFELVLKSAPDNILASRYLAECLENLGDRDGAIARYKATLTMAPAEKHVLARLQELEKGTAAPVAAKAATIPPTPAVRSPTTTLRPSARSVTPAVAPPAPVPPAAPTPTAVAAPVIPAPAVPEPTPAPPPPIPLSTVEGEMELETSRGPEMAAPTAAPAGASPFAPIPLVAADEEFELEAPHEAPVTGWAASIRPLPVVEDAPRSTPAAQPPAAASPQQPPPASAPSALLSPTLGELYFNQGFTDKAIEVYRELSAREPGSERLSARLRELEKLQRALSGGESPAAASGAPGDEPTAAADGATERRQAIERTIVRLEGLLSAIRKG